MDKVVSKTKDIPLPLRKIRSIRNEPVENLIVTEDDYLIYIKRGEYRTRIATPLQASFGEDGIILFREVYKASPYKLKFWKLLWKHVLNKKQKQSLIFTVISVFISALSFIHILFGIVGFLMSLFGIIMVYLSIEIDSSDWLGEKKIRSKEEMLASLQQARKDRDNGVEV